jgi:AmmeMemoRadiSam system protein B
MPVPQRPQLRAVEFVPVGPEREPGFALRDPEEIGQCVVLSAGGALLATLMDGRRTLGEIQEGFRARTGLPAALADVEKVVHRLDEAHLLRSERFERRQRSVIEAFLRNPVRPATHAGVAYSEEPDELRRQLDAAFTTQGGPGPVDPGANSDGRRLCGLIAPHIDPERGRTTFAWAYKQVAEACDADRFVIFGTAHGPVEQPFCLSRKHFDTPLGLVRTDRQFVDRIAEHLASSVAGRQLDVFADEPAHRMEHSIEFQTVFLQHLFGGRRAFRIVPVLIGSFQEFFEGGMTPGDSPEVQAMLAAVLAAAKAHRGPVCFISAADLAHIGPRYGDPEGLDEARLDEQARDDRQLLDKACAGDADAVFHHVAEQNDRARICGLGPTYVMLEVLRAAHGISAGRLLHYHQAVAPEGAACVSFASVGFFEGSRL